MKTNITVVAVDKWLAELALTALRLKFRCPDYRFELEETQHVMNPTCVPYVRQVHIVCHTNFTPPAPLVRAWRGESSLR